MLLIVESGFSRLEAILDLELGGDRDRRLGPSGHGGSTLPSQIKRVSNSLLLFFALPGMIFAHFS